MSESQRPKSAALGFEIPDLELEPAPRSKRAVGSVEPPRTGQGYGASNRFDDDAFEAGSGIPLELDQHAYPGVVNFGSSVDFGESGGLELEPVTEAAIHVSELGSALARPVQTAKAMGGAEWPSGQTPNAEALSIDPREVSSLAHYGLPPRSAYLTPAYAYRVFRRQRELKWQLRALCAERDRAELERETVLAELARAVRPLAETIAGFQRFFAPLLDAEQVGSQRGQALSTVNAELFAHSASLDAELTRTAEQVIVQQTVQQNAERACAEREQNAQRASAKLKRAQIEIRAVTQVAEQKLGPRGGPVPEPEAGQLAMLRLRAEAIVPEVAQANAELEGAKAALGQAQGQLEALRQAQRNATRKKQALAEHYQQELQSRRVGLSESETQQRTALAEVGRAVLATRGALPVDAAWLDRIRIVSARADGLILECETQRRALDAYDRARVAQGVRLACTALALLIVLLVLRITL